jgi:hypothetical protein
MKLEFSRQSFEKYSNIKFHENLSSGCQVVPYRRPDRTKLIVAFCNFANASKNETANRNQLHMLTMEFKSTLPCSY